MVSDTSQKSVKTAFVPPLRGQRTTSARRTRSSVEQSRYSSFLRPNPIGNRHARVSSVNSSVNFDSEHNNIAPRRPTKKFVVGTDYGTTFTSVSYYAIEKVGQEHLVRASDIKTVKNWPDAPHEGDEQVPTESWYSPVPMMREALKDNEQFDATKSKPSSIRIVEEEYDDGDENDNQVPGVDEGSSNPTPNEERIESWSFDEPQSTEFFWGWSVAQQRYEQCLPRDQELLVQRSKLMMLSTAFTEGGRKDLRRQIARLIKSGIIRKYGKKSQPDVRDVRDVITDFLIKIFEHTKNYLAREEGYTKDCPVEFVITVPTVWSQEASRILQFCVEAAIQATEFGSLKNGSVDNLFLIPEPEAGLTWLLQNTSSMVAGEDVSLLDAGGGTVDCVTYELSKSHPLSLEHEIVDPGGDNCGSSYLNENFKQHIQHRLRDETYIEGNGITRKSIASKLAALQFEIYGKKKINIYKRPDGSYFVQNLRGDKARGLKGPAAKRFGDNKVYLNEGDYEEIFLPVLQRVWGVLQNQLDAAFDQGKRIKNIFLLGGFAASPSLTAAIQHGLAEYTKELDLPYHIRLIEDSKKSDAAVSSGAVLRALNKGKGPTRRAQSSYGFLRREHYQHLVCKAHSRATPIIDTVDGELYVDVINYFMIKGQSVDAVHEYPPIRAIHTFPLDPKGKPLLEMRCEELLYVSDTATESHYAPTNHKNKDAQIAGTIVTDMTFLRDKGHIDITYPEPDDYGVTRGRPHYRVEYDLVVIAEGRNLRYEARWTPKDNDQGSKKRKRSGQHKFEVVQTAQVSIASAFRPGTS